MRAQRLGPLPLLIWTWVFGCAPAAPPLPPPPLPNIFLISIDTLRPDHLGSYGYERDTSPFLDELAGEGTRFEEAVVVTHGTAPSHASMLTSLPQELHRVAYADATAMGLPDDITMLQEYLQERGYVTLATTGGGNIGRRLGFARGFDQFNHRARKVNAGAHKMVKMIRNHSGSGQPIFAFFHTYQVHSPYQPPERYRELFGKYDSTFIPTSENLLAIIDEPRAHLSEEDLNHIEALYDAGIRFTDDTLRDLFRQLRELGFLDDVVVVVTSDHGEEFAEHGGLLHGGQLYDELLRVPLIFQGRGIAAGIIDDRRVTSLDVAPTLLGCAGLEIPAEMQGRDLLCGTHAGSGDSDQEVTDLAISQYGPRFYSIRTADWKYIESRASGIELYHLPSDPGETHNVVADHRDVALRFRSHLRRWRAQHAPHARQAAGVVDYSEEEKKDLRALGYLAQ
jgi:arylsulfatase A-like enzyme